MATKLDRSTYPDSSISDDFLCFGPAASQDTIFSDTRLAEMGCFVQDEKDSDKYYLCCICKHKSNNVWYLYVEYGRKGAANPQFQFTQCSSESEAQKLYEKQCAEKNTKRGEWQSIAGLNLYRPVVKKGKPEDLYVVKDNATRSVGLPNGRNIVSATHEATKSAKIAPTSKKKGHRCDPQTTKLMRDLLGGAITYTRSTLVGGTIPTQSAIDTSRQILGSAIQRVGVVGDDVTAQVNDHDLKQLTYTLYGLMPKSKPLGAAESTWILSKDNIVLWQQDIDAFETALKTDSGELEIEGDDPMDSMPLDMEWIDPKTDVFKKAFAWWSKASNNRNGYGALKIHNLWKLNRHADDETPLRKYQDKVIAQMGDNWNGERPLFQERERFDLNPTDQERWWKSNSALLFHGSRSCNIPGILRENLRLPGDLVGVVINGANFGAGIYMADDWQKSAGYTSLQNSYWSKGQGGIANRHAFMIACDCVMGNPHLAEKSHGYKNYPSKTHCVFGKGGYTKWDSYGSQKLVNNEWITFDRKPVLRYLAEFSTGR